MFPKLYFDGSQTTAPGTEDTVWAIRWVIFNSELDIAVQKIVCRQSLATNDERDKHRHLDLALKDQARRLREQSCALS